MKSANRLTGNRFETALAEHNSDHPGETHASEYFVKSLKTRIQREFTMRNETLSNRIQHEKN